MKHKIKVKISVQSRQKRQKREKRQICNQETKAHENEIKIVAANFGNIKSGKNKDVAIKGRRLV